MRFIVALLVEWLNIILLFSLLSNNNDDIHHVSMTTTSYGAHAPLIILYPPNYTRGALHK